MPFSDFFGPRQYKNPEVFLLAATAHEACANTAGEASASLTVGLNPHAITRCRDWIARFSGLLEAVHNQPAPDYTKVHPILLNVAWQEPSMPVDQFGEPLNQTTYTMMTKWQIIADELIKSNSAGLGGGMSDADYRRAKNNVDALEQLLNAIEASGDTDFPETADPAAPEGKKSGKK